MHLQPYEEMSNSGKNLNEMCERNILQLKANTESPK